MIQPPIPTLPREAGGPQSRPAGSQTRTAADRGAAWLEQEPVGGDGRNALAGFGGDGRNALAAFGEAGLDALSAFGDAGSNALSTGGDPARRAAVEERDPLVASAVRMALTELGYVIDAHASPALRFVGLGGLEAVASCRLRRRPVADGGLVVGYTLRAPLAAALHRVHGCADTVLVLDVAADGARFRHLCWPDVLARAGLTSREADVLALLLTRRTNAEIARQLVVADATVRAHCRSVLRKLELPHRRALWSRAEAEWCEAEIR